MTTIVWADGQIYDADEPIVSGLDRSLLLGVGVFETMAVEKSGPFAVTRHLDRLQNSSRALGLPIPPLTDIRDAIDEAVDAWRQHNPPGQRGRLRLTITGGPGPMGLTMTDAVPTVLVAISSAQSAGIGQGIKAVTSPWTVNPNTPLAGTKTTSYGSQTVLMNYARERGAQEAISSTVTGEVSEGAASNIFIERDGELLTPRLATGCLAGITRALLLEWGAAEKLPVREAEEGELPAPLLEQVPAPGLHLALTGSVKGIQPITQLDGRNIEPGPITNQLAEIYFQRVAQSPAP